MAKTLKQILDGIKSSKIKSKDILGTKPGVDYSPKAGDERKFADKHEIEQHADRVGNDDDVYNATNVKSYMDTSQSVHHGYKAGEDEKVYEEAKCNMTKEGKLCGVHGTKACPKTGLKETPVEKEHELEGANLTEGRVVAVKSVMNSRGGEDRYEMQHHGTGKGWHSIIKTHQDGNNLHAMHGFHNVVHVGSEKYIAGKWKTIKHANTKAAEPVKEEKIDEISRDLASRYINKTTDNPKRKTSRDLALLKKWGDKKFGLPEPKVKATEEVEQVDEFLVQNYISGSKNKRAEVHKIGDDYAVKKYNAAHGGTVISTSKHNDANSAHATAKKHLGEDTEELDEKAIAKSKQTMLVMLKKDRIKNTKTGGGVLRIKKSEYDPKKHDLAEDQDQIDEREMTSGETKKREEIVKSMKKKLSDFRARYGARAKDVMYATATKQAMKEYLAQPLVGSNDSAKKKDKKKEMEQAPAVTPITLPNFSVDVNTGRNV
jgi:hypothetical protein